MMAVMADRDPAFLWETEALRTAVAPPAPVLRREPVPETRSSRPGDGWVTLREASAATGIPVATLRKWALKSKVASVLEETGVGARRMVSLEGIRARAQSLGRDDVGPRVTTSLTPSSEAPSAEAATPPPGTMLVPIDAWDKMLIQLGNLHQAGQQLAEARERAARAETEASFLRDRLAEIRSTRDETGAGDRQPTPPRPATARGRGDSASGDDRPSFTVYLWRSAVSGLRRRL